MSEALLPVALAAAAVLTAASGETPPPAPADRIAPWVGRYGPDGASVDVSERDGALYAEGGGLAGEAPLRPLGGDRFLGAGPTGEPLLLAFSHRRGGRTTLSTPAGRREARDPGAEVQARIRRGVRANWAGLRGAALQAAPPREPPARTAPDLVRLADVGPGVRLDIRYAGRANFMGVPLYERADAFLQRPAAEALARVQAGLRAEGLGLAVYDAYRPWFVTRLFWDATPPAFHGFVADPAQGSRHNRGCAVDLGLIDLATGRVVEMPSRYDEFSPRAYPDYPGGTSRQRWFRDRLRRAMEAQGFTVYTQEWWHFDYRDWAGYPIQNTSFTALERRARRP